MKQKNITPDRSVIALVAGYMIFLGVGVSGLLFWVFDGSPRYWSTLVGTPIAFVFVWGFILKYLLVLIPTMRGRGGVRIEGGRVIFASPLFCSVPVSDVVGFEVVMLRSWGRDLPHVRLNLTGNRKKDLPVYFLVMGEGQAIEALKDARRNVDNA